MHMTRRTDVILIGAGAAGLFASLQMAQRGMACTILDTNPLAAFASTRNQGWLHQGGFQAAVANDPIAARACRDGYRWIESHYPDLIRPGIPCYFLMHKEEDLQRCIKLCQQEDISARPISINAVKEQEPILKESSLAYAMRTSDAPVDTSRLLQVILDEVYQRGVRFQAVKSLEVIRPMWDGKMWHVFFEQEQEIQARVVVLTCGVAIPEMVKRFLPDEPTRFMRTKIPVVVLRGDVARSMLITLYAPLGPHLVPFNGGDGNGASICIAHTDKEITDYRDTTLPDNFLAACQESFAEFYHGYPTQRIEEGTLRGHVYVCQKLHLPDDLSAHSISRAAIHLSYALQSGGQKNLFVFYPGKFTAAPIAAVTCADEVEQCLSDQRVCSSQSEGAVSVPTIARQRYYDTPESILAVQNGELVLRPIK
jgi:hypothetical protein